MIRFSERAIFTSVLLAFCALIFWITLGLGPVARLVPLKVAVVTLALIFFQLLLDTLPRLAHRIYGNGLTDPSKTKQIKRVVKNPTRSNHHKGGGRDPTLTTELGVFLWILIIPAAIYLFGFLTAAPLYTLFFFKVHSREGWPVSLAAATGLFCLLYGLFDVLLNTRLEAGIFWRWLW